MNLTSKDLSRIVNILNSQLSLVTTSLHVLKGTKEYEKAYQLGEEIVDTLAKVEVLQMEVNYARYGK